MLLLLLLKEYRKCRPGLDHPSRTISIKRYQRFVKQDLRCFLFVMSTGPR